MALSITSQAAIIFTAFIIPVLTYIYLTRASNEQKDTAGPLPASTEITALYIHPIKSCHGISVQSAKLLPTGLDLGKTDLLTVVVPQTHVDGNRPPMDVGDIPGL
jgi:hypothetical protein